MYVIYYSVPLFAFLDPRILQISNEKMVKGQLQLPMYPVPTVLSISPPWQARYRPPSAWAPSPFSPPQTPQAIHSFPPLPLAYPRITLLISLTRTSEACKLRHADGLAVVGGSVCHCGGGRCASSLGVNLRFAIRGSREARGGGARSE